MHRQAFALDSAEATRLRHLENEARIRPVVGVLAVFGLFALVVAALTLPRSVVLSASALLLGFGSVVVLSQTRLAHSDRPELWLLVEQNTGIVAFSILLAVSGGLDSPAIGLMALGIALAGTRFRGRTLAVVAVSNTLMMFAGCFVADPQMLVNHAPEIYLWCAVMTGIAGLTTILANSERTARAEAVLDPLTGLLNRKALSRRGQELEEQARLSGLPVSVVAMDLDGFKGVNDRLGHDAGDAVLQQVAYAMRKALRGFDLLYRTGGDEFLVLLPGADAEQAGRVAEELRLAVLALDGDCADVTLSSGVASAAGADVALSRMLIDADQALYAAKAGGRNQVHLPELQAA